MKSKIEKLEYNYLLDGSIKTAPHPLDITEKINEIIDYLNSQSQPEESNFVHTVGTPILEGITTCSQDTPEDTEHIKAHKEYLATSKQDTPEEWREYYRKLYKPAMDERMYEILESDIAKLLDDRERENRRDGALAFYIELEDWLYGKGYAKHREIKVPTEVFMRFVAKELKLNSKKK